MFVKHAEDDYVVASPGVARRTLAYGSATLVAEFRLTAGHELPTHSHPHEQSGYLVRGRIRLRIGDDEHEVAPGDSWSIPGGIEHGASVVEDSIAVEVFAPVREDYLP